MKKLYGWFDRRCKSYSSRINLLRSRKGAIPDWEHRYLTESLMSEMWQSWCHFNRLLLLRSLRGGTARDGSAIVARVSDNSWRRIGYEAKQASQSLPPKPTKHLNFMMWKEPTWGDLDAYIRIVIGLNPSNSTVLLSSFGIPYVGVKELQLVRNCCAHKNVENIFGLQALSATYDVRGVRFSADFAWVKEISSHNVAIEIWSYHMNLMADLATATS